MHVVTAEPVTDRSLRRTGLESRMRIYRAGACIESGIRDAVDPDAAVVVVDVLQQPLDRVVGVGRFVDLLGRIVGDVGTHVHEFALTHPSASYILVNEN